MALDNFRTQKIIWDKANKKIFETIEANSGDSSGRKLVVQVINQETTENLSGTTLSLGWKSRNGAKGLDAFDVVDASKGIFEIYYTTEMLSNIGNIEASLILIDSTSRIESSTFTISVRPSTVDDESVESENSFTALTEALVKVNDFDAQLAQTELQLDNRINIVDAKKIDKNRGGVTSADLSQEVKEQITGGSVAVVGENAVNTINLMDQAVTSDKIKDGIITEEKLAFQLKPMRVKVDTPVGFNWSYHPLVDKIYTDGMGNFKVDGFDINQYKISGKAYYVDGAGGSNSNDGLTMNTAFQTIYKAAEMPDVDVIRIKGGRYARNRLIRFPIERDITIESWDETPVEMSTHENLTWTKQNGYANVYKSSRTFGYMAIDTNYKDEHGNYVPYTTVGSVEEVDSTPGSFYTDLETVYVHSIDNRPVDNTILVLLIVQNIKQSGGYSIFLDNIHVLGGNEPVVTAKIDDSIPNIYAKNSRFLYSDRGAGGLSTYGVGNAFLQNCHAAYNAKDGFNYHTSIVESKIIEIDCLGYRNGKLGSGDQDNGSTLHDGMKGIRIGGAYYENVGPNVHDIYTGAQSWNLGLFAGKSKGAHELRNADYYVENNAESWFDSCVSYGSNLSVRTVNGTTTKANIRNTQLFDREQIAAGSIDTY